MITYNTIIQYFDAISKRHTQINSFTYGEISLLDDSKFTKYPALHLTPTTTSISDQTIEYGFEVIVFDRYDNENNKMVNEAICLSDSLLILQDLCKELTDGRYFINEDTLINLGLPIQASPFIDTKPDICSGWSTSFSISTPNEASACLIPYYNSEKQYALNVQIPSYVPTNIVWYSRQQAHTFMDIDSGGTLTTLRPFRDILQGTNDLTANREVDWNWQSNGFVFNGTESNLEHPRTTSTNCTFFIRLKDFGRYTDVAGNNNYLLELGSQEVVVKITSQGNISIVSDNNTESSPYPVVPNNLDNNNNAEQLIRKDSYTFCVKQQADSLRLYYGMLENEYVEMQTSFRLTDKQFFVGSSNTIFSSIFTLQEFIFYAGFMVDSDISQTMQWLNYR